ncbi:MULTISPECIES: methyl-accepting chemotaxis protein [Bradyrhizobium]|uniref:Bll2993 protein n=1 Tax=Bradyrhizobium diazoefficiens (strain JCM 10833 / BCRC 13528 / IAM 13628 / NBRC 14792 / USDA 110) TaxID=224911 RepID=Q89QX9_BRADU|nr:methyl-accepting chemotaxis protein [Bradyrhizobium diazoefficiens]MBP1067068.1 methyl-accepting chemotaxis protein [Bradyrhizobium japonicum]AND88443.1 chemotaxis protein [Bradyrhizobium diazoefficiens USDA 110]AWO89996.1 HAMP domain-containing protein [Bradyrhizobium diazoefficiens]PDT63359.1 methyl-accepting chemotaxis protein [Bradyrhizobium diazoefficiens]QBP21810.1 methyl-accepting chemotaxis protein [Bradyrhizobium diazoefficiens]
MTIDQSGNAAGLAGRFTLATKLYAIFALFALLTAAIAMLSDYNSRRSADLTSAIETANAAALNVERVNSLVYAVVMESRGVYMSTEPAVVKKYGEGLLKFNAQILDVVKRWETIVRDDDAEQFATFRKRIEQFVEFRKELVRRGVEINAAAGREWGDNDANRAVRSALNKDLEALSKVYAERGKQIARQTETNRTLSFVLTSLAGVALALVVIGIVIIARSIARPLASITATIKQVADGAENVVVPYGNRADEIGGLARAIQIFQDAMGRNRNLASQVSQDSAAREQRARHIEQSVEEFRDAIGAIMRGLGDNASVMRETAQTITRVTADASNRAGMAANASQQASHNVTAVAGAAEELSASVEEIGRQVRQSAGAVEQTGQRTEKSISEIESLAAATQRIDGVLNLIQAIAEQTNLLALNATIEAARAGDAGRGFAVVAHEVKALAGQTAKATAEIGENVSMIQASTRNAVDAVREIGGAVREINEVTSAIAGAVGQQDQATREISSNAQSAAQGNETLVANITSLRDAIGETDTAASSVLTAASSLTATAETLSREVEKFFQNLRSDARAARAG